MDLPWLISYYIQQVSDFMHHTVGDRVTEVVFQVIGPAKTVIDWLSVPVMIFLNSLVQAFGSPVWFFAQLILAIFFATDDSDGSARAALD